MKMSIQLFGHASCRFDMDGVTVWFNPTHAWATAGRSASMQTAHWCWLTLADMAQTHAVVTWAASTPMARFVAPQPVASALISAGLPVDRLCSARDANAANASNASNNGDTGNIDLLTLAMVLAPGLHLRASDAVIAPADEQISHSPRANDNALLFADARSARALAALRMAHSIASTSVTVPAIDVKTAASGAQTAAGAVPAAELVPVPVPVPIPGVRCVRQALAACNGATGAGFFAKALRLKVSIVVRTLNEARYLGQLLEGIAAQKTNALDCEVVLVDSGSTDDTLAIAARFGCHVLHITREEFSFGRSLNMGCAAATGAILIITSGHCVPADPQWLQALCQPLLDGKAQYSYGMQLGGMQSHFSECRVFEKYFPGQSQIPQQSFYCNNANSALLKSVWQRYRFDEDLTGLEDMELGKRLVNGGGQIAYVAEARVHHHHAEKWSQVRRRFEREAIALQEIMPNVNVSLLDAVRYMVSSIWLDWAHARRTGVWLQEARKIVLYRYHQYSGSYRGNHEHHKLASAEKDKYFYPH